MRKTLLLSFVMLLSSVCLMAQNLKGELTNVTTLKKPGAITRALTDKYLWGYYDGGQAGYMGPTSTMTYDLCIYVPGDKQFTGATFAGIYFPIIQTDIKSAKVWVRNGLTEANVYEETVSNLTVGDFNQVIFKQPVNIPAEGAYIGFTITTAQGGVTLGINPDGNYGQSFIITGGYVYDAAMFGYGPVPMYAIVSNIDLQPSAWLTPEKSYIVAKAGTQCEMDAMVTLGSPEEIKSFTLEVDNGEKKETVDCTLDGALQALRTDVQFDFTYTAPAAVSTNHNLKVTVTKINNTPNTAKDATLTIPLMTVSREAVRRNVGEIIASTTSGDSPLGWAGNEEAKALYPDNYIGVVLHQSDDTDPMYIAPDKYYRHGGEKDGIGYFLLNRQYADEGEMICEYLDEVADELPIADITAKAMWTSDDKTAVRITSEVTALTNDIGDMKVSYILTADDLKSVTTAWKQANNYATYEQSEDYSSWLNMFLNGGQYGKTSISNMPNNDVVIATSYDNYLTTVPTIAAMNDGGKASTSVTLELPTTTALKNPLSVAKKNNNIHAVAIVEEASTVIINAVKVDISDYDPTGIETVTTTPDKSVVKTYTIDGRETTTASRGIVIQRLADGTARKIMKR
ncbi:MAG: hypothetical protein ACI3Y5_03720 [Prevotella sp.]